jgi:glutathione S-transferase
MERYQLMSLLNFIATEVHGPMGELFDKTLPEATRGKAIAAVGKRLDFIEQQLAGKTWLTGEHFTVADCYLFTVLGWARWVKFDLSKWPRIGEYLARVAARPAVQAALKAEGLVK